MPSGTGLNKTKLVADLIKLQNDMEKMTTAGADHNNLKTQWAKRMADIIDGYVRSGKVITKVNTVGEPVLPVLVVYPAGTGTTLNPDTATGTGEGRII
jgi:hypothetical protein